ncbi:SbtR family transcriptional regulator [Pseudonocardia sp. Cha107L01]|uniref:SbtR family transcriptional regulator n=1 Tax=Pseudonocardia sp. Cha107L01 TaxID=3457576 RepID=UPI00403E98DF
MEQTDTRVLAELTGLVDRAKQAGQLRQDFEVSDILLASAAIQSAADFGGTNHPRLYRRLIGILIDGLRTSRSEPTLLSEAAVGQRNHRESNRTTPCRQVQRATP